MQWITAAEINDWTQKQPRRAQEILPELVGRLIYSSIETMDGFHFPYGNAILYAGLDGYLNTNRETKHFPAGVSVWEFGTNEDILGKFNSDYEKRAKDNDIKNKNKKSFYFVTSRIWNHKKGMGELILEKSDEKIWKSVRIMDAQYLALWLEENLEVSVWFAELMGKNIQGLEPLDIFFKRLCKMTTPNLTTEFFLCGREDITEQIIEIFKGNYDKKAVLYGESSKESLLVLVSGLLESTNDEAKRFLDKCVYVADAATWENLNLGTSNKDAIFVLPFFCDKRKLKRECNILFIVDRFSIIVRSDKIAKVKIERPRKSDYSIALSKIGVEKENIHRIFIQTRYNFDAILRILGNDAVPMVPKWLDREHDEIKLLLPAMLCGSWDERFEGDKRVIEQISGYSYDEYIEKLSIFLQEEDAPIINILSTWMIINHKELWLFIFDELSKDCLKKFKESIESVLCYKNPKYELPEDKWWCASSYDKVPIYSEYLISGILQSLVIRELYIEDELYGEFSVPEIFSRIFNAINCWQQWFSIAPYFPICVEAAPSIFLSKLEEKLNKNDDEFLMLFKKQGDPLFHSNPYTMILFALEKLSWNRNHISRVIMLLVEIESKKFSYKLVNSPSESLNKIFCLFYNQTCLSSQEKLELLKRIIKKYPQIGIKLIEQILVGHSISSICKPDWLEFDSLDENIEDEECRDIYKSLVPIYLENANVENWQFIFRNYMYFESNEDELLMKCKNQFNEVDIDKRLEFCKFLIRLITMHRKFLKKWKKINEASLNKIEQLLKDILPKSEQRYTVWFIFGFEGLHPVSSGESDFTENNKIIVAEQKRIMQECFACYGKEAVLKMAPNIENKRAFAQSIAEVIFNNKVDVEFFEKIYVSDSILASELILRLYWNMDFDTFIENIEEFNSELHMFCLLCLNIDANILKYIENKNIGITYWEKISFYKINTDNKEVLNITIPELLKVKRYWAAIKLMGSGEYQDISIIIQTMRNALTDEKSIIEKEIEGSFSYELKKLFEILWVEKEKYKQDIEILEFMYMSIGLFNKSQYDRFEPKFLIKKILTEPDFFVECLSSAFKSDEKEMDIEDIEINAKAAQYYYKLLEFVNTIPGCTNGEVEDEFLRNWIHVTKEKAKENKRYEAWQLYLGKILSCAPVGEDGIWPCESVRDLFEEGVTAESNIINSFIIGKLNQRGIHSFTEGREEEELANEYLGNAEKIKVMYPVTASILKRIGGDYLRDSDFDNKSALRDHC